MADSPKAKVPPAAPSEPPKRRSAAVVLEETRARQKEHEDALAKELDAAKPKPSKSKPVVVQDVVTPAITGKDVMAGFKHHMQVTEQAKLRTLARRYPEVGRLLSKT